MISVLLGAVLTAVLKAIWSWQGENIKKWGGKAWKAVKGFFGRLRAGLGRCWCRLGGRLAVWQDQFSTFIQNNF